ncbi:MAG: hypothetical protein IPM82_19755 [Saprospiraceae bacterium]|nr:hypothetical protein [Saprospiraceae bacterium]
MSAGAEAAAPQNICSYLITHESQGAAHRNISVRCTLRRLHRKILQRFRSAAASAPTDKYPQLALFFKKQD